MLIGVPRELKDHETRVGLTPAGARELARGDNQVVVEAGAGDRCGFADDDYRAEGAGIATAEQIWAEADLIVKVKEPLSSEADLLSADQTLFTYLHLAAEPELTRRLADSGATCIAYETVTDKAGGLPLLAPMSEVAGRLAVQIGAQALTSLHRGRGVLLSGVTGVRPSRAVVIGGGVAGTSAALVAVGLGAQTVVFDRSITRLHELRAQFGSAIETCYSTAQALEEALVDSDLVIGAVLIPGARAPHVVTREMLGLMRPGSVIVDISIDQGGCIETAHPTTYSDPTFEVDGVVHSCVSNLPAAVGVTATLALSNATLPRLLRMAELGVDAALDADPGLRDGLNVARGQITHPALSRVVGG